MSRTVTRWGTAAGALVCLLPLLAAPAVAGGYGKPGGAGPPKSTSAPQRDKATSTTSGQSCSLYGSSAGFGMVCSGAAGGKTLAQLFSEAGIDTSDEFCWDDPDLPDGFEPEKQRSGPGRWWLHTCLSFERKIVSRTTTNLTYEYHFHEPGTEKELSDAQEAVIELVTGRGQIPFLQVQTSPISSPRVKQPIAFSMLCDSRVVCNASAGTVVTRRLKVGGVDMWAELVHLRVLPEGAARPEKVVDCARAGKPQTAEQLDEGDRDDPTVCRYEYERSSNSAGGGTSGDRYPARVTAYWRIFVDEGNGPRPLRNGDEDASTYEKSTTNQIRVTEVQTLVVS